MRKGWTGCHTLLFTWNGEGVDWVSHPLVYLE